MALRYIPNALPVPSVLGTSADRLIGEGGLKSFDLKELTTIVRFLYQELLNISKSINDNTELPYDIGDVEPLKKTVGMIKFADGTNWNPGAGRGLYIYNSNRWEKL